MLYKQSIYNLTKCYSKEYLIYNLASNQIAVLDETSYAILTHCADFQGDINEATRQTLRSLYEVGFIVESEKNEIAFVNSRRQSMIYFNTHEKCFVILPTTDCNARCYYCYQGEWSPQNMNQQTAADIISFIKRTVPDGDNVHIAWFGGEPLYNYTIAKLINDAILQHFGDRYHATMTSNGSLITEKLAKELRYGWHIDGIQITIDNLYEKYELTKAYTDNTKFQDIINAITYCLSNGIQIIARINVDKTNIDDLEEIYSFLIKKFGNNSKFKIDIALLKEECAFQCNKLLFEEAEYPSILKKILQIELKYNGKQTINSFMCAQKFCTCLAQSIQGVVIAPDGKLYKCQHIHDQDCIGNIYDGIVFNDNMEYFLNPNIDEECKNCKFLPICQGGCINFKKHGITTGSRCAKIKFDYETRLDIIYGLYNDNSKKEVQKNDDAHKI